MSDLNELVKTLSNLDRHRQIYRLSYYKPYPYQVQFHNAEGFKTPGVPASQRLLCCANKVGKTYSAAMEVAIHATGKYPDWWRGTRFFYPPEILVSGLTNDSVRDIGQRELFGDPTNDKMLGTGSVPIDCIGKIRNKAGVQNAYDSVQVKHVSGQWSRIYLRAYEQGWKKFQGVAFDVAWPDEEPPSEIWSQLLRAGIARRQAIILCTMTPEEGMTEVVTGFMDNLQKGQALIGATWDDAPHISKESKEQKLAALRPHERDMRSKGIPLQGAGVIFQISDDELCVEPFAIPRHWAQIIGVDFGISTQHPFSAARLAIDRDTQTTYLVNEYQTTNEAAAVHVEAVKSWPDWIPVAWPHDGLNREKGSGEQLKEIYRKKGLNLLPEKATNPPQPGEKEGEGGNSVEASVLAMYDDMVTGKFKVVSSCTQFLREKRIYHRDLKAKIVRLNEDLICAARYAHMYRRFARTQSVLPAKKTGGYVGLSNWG